MRLRHAALFLLALALAAGAWVKARSFRSSSGARAPLSAPAPAAEPARALPHQLTPERLKTLAEHLLDDEKSRSFPPPSRNIFRRGATASLSGASLPALEPAGSPLPSPATPTAPSAAELTLTGFLERPGPAGATECLAVFRFEGEIHLVREGESVGAYRVEKIVNGEQVRLLHRVTGTERVFRIE